MKNSKGITLASLVILIASIIILSTMAIGYGYRHLKETKYADEKYFTEVLSSAVQKRENNFVVNSTTYPRIGYHITTLDAFEDILTNYVPELKSNSEILFDRGLWYIVDTDTATKLGVKGSSKYIDVFDVDNDKEMKVALTEYHSGAVYLFKINKEGLGEIKDDISSTEIEPIDGHVHQYNIETATCTADKRCVICGYVVEVALGHVYEDGGSGYTWVDAEFHYCKECTRCHMKGGYERHKDIDGFVFYKSGDGLWYHYNGCSVCGWPGPEKNYIPCDTTIKSVSDTEHAKVCKVCKHEELSNHELNYAYVDESYHEQVCGICGYVKIRHELHEGEHICNKCGCEIIKVDNPVLVNIELKNKEYPDSHYITDGETIQLIFTADKMITEADVTICGYAGNNISYTYSTNRLTCTAEVTLDENIIIAQNSKITFTINCKSVTTDKWLVSNMTETTNSDSYLIYDSIAPLIEYIPKEEY